MNSAAAAQATDLKLPRGDLWIFGYGSLMWRPGFEFLAAEPARLFGYHRALCVRSWVHRGSRAKPGLILGLDQGGSCLGRGFRVAARFKSAVVDYLFSREMVTPVYVPVLQNIHLSGRRVQALTFIIDRKHPQYAGRLSLDEGVAIVRASQGISGSNRDYVLNTVAHLEEQGVMDEFLFRLRDRLISGELLK